MRRSVRELRESSSRGLAAAEFLLRRAEDSARRCRKKHAHGVGDRARGRRRRRLGTHHRAHGKRSGPVDHREGGPDWKRPPRCSVRRERLRRVSSPQGCARTGAASDGAACHVFPRPRGPRVGARQSCRKVDRTLTSRLLRAQVSLRDGARPRPLGGERGALASQGPARLCGAARLCL